MTITTRAVKGSALTWDEIDANFTEMQTLADAATAAQIAADASLAAAQTLFNRIYLGVS